jgi:hypothetical protein
VGIAAADAGAVTDAEGFTRPWQEVGRARLRYDRARVLLGQYSDGPKPHQLRHSSATRLGEVNASVTGEMPHVGAARRQVVMEPAT